MDGAPDQPKGVTAGTTSDGKLALLLSAEWFDRIRMEVARLARETPATDLFVLVETYRRSPPAPTLFGDGVPGYRLEIENGEVRLSIGVTEANRQADVEATLDFQALRELVLLKVGPELEARSAVYAAEGKLRISGDVSRAPVDLVRLHDALAACTLVE